MKKMGEITYSKNQNRLKRNYLVIFTFINFIFIGIVFLITLKVEVNVTKLIIFVCIMFFYVNVRFVFSYFKAIQSLTSMKTYYDLDKNDRNKYLIAVLILLGTTLLSIFLIFVKGMLLIGLGVMIVNGYTFIYFHKRLLKGTRKIERDNL